MPLRYTKSQNPRRSRTRTSRLGSRTIPKHFLESKSSRTKKFDKQKTGPTQSRKQTKNVLTKKRNTRGGSDGIKAADRRRRIPYVRARGSKRHQMDTKTRQVETEEAFVTFLFEYVRNVYPMIQNNSKYYFESSEFAKSLTQNQQQLLQELINRVSTDIQKEIYKIITPEENRMLSQMLTQGTEEVHRLSVLLQDKIRYQHRTGTDLDFSRDNLTIIPTAAKAASATRKANKSRTLFS